MLTQRQEQFALNLLKGLTQRESWIQAGYSDKCPLAMVDSHACRLANKDKIKARLSELRAEVALEVKKAKIADTIERQEILSEIARGNLLDYQEMGADGGYLSISKDSPNTRAISEITSRTEYDKDGSGATLVSKVKLHNPVQAIDLLNKMDKVYSEGVTNYNDIKVLIVREAPKEIAGLVEGMVRLTEGKEVEG